MNDELIHYGVKGMRWGVRKTQKKESLETKKQMIRTNPNSNKKINKKVDYLDKSIPERVAIEVGKAAVQKIIFAAATGKLDKYTNMNSKQLGKEVVLTAINTGVRVTVKTANAKRSINKYEGDE